MRSLIIGPLIAASSVPTRLVTAPLQLPGRSPTFDLLRCVPFVLQHRILRREARV